MMLNSTISMVGECQTVQVVALCSGRLSALFSVALVMGGCSAGGMSKADVEQARHFEAFPLYWVGQRFEKWELEAIDGLDGPAQFVTFIYGTCTPHDGDEPSCVPPIEIQLSPLCTHLDVVAARPIWRYRRIRGAPVGSNPDGAPVLFSSRAQVKVYRGEGTDQTVALRVLRGLRSLNRVGPVIGSGGPIPAVPDGVLTGTRPCAP
jgi:hypothetical protein